MTEPSEPRPEPNLDIYAGRDAPSKYAVNIGEKVEGLLIGDGGTQYNDFRRNVINNSPDNRETLASSVQGESVLEDLYKRFDLARFTGRTELIEEIEGFIASHDHGWVVVEGQAGVGKSTLATYLVMEDPKKNLKKKDAWFFHSTSSDAAESPESVRKNLAAQLIHAFDLSGEYAPDGKFPADGASPEYVARVLTAAAKAGTGPTGRRPIVLVIDSLNEIESAGQIADPVGLPTAKHLPYKVFVVATRRPAPAPWLLDSPTLLADLETGETHDLGDELEDVDAQDTSNHPSGPNAQDMREYIRGLLHGPDADQDLVKKLRSHDLVPDSFIEALVTRCAGVWLYLTVVLGEVRRGENPADVIVSLPGDVRTAYLNQIRQLREADRAKWRNLHCPALATLAAIRRPVTCDELADFGGIDDGGREALRDWLDDEIKPLLHIGEDPASLDSTYEIRHPILREVVADPKTRDSLDRELRQALRRAHGKITAHLIPPGVPGERDWANADPYVRGTLAEHAAAAERLDELVTDPGFLLICQPSSVLLRRRYLKTGTGVRAVSAYEAALSEWAEQPADDVERAWRLHVWARKTGTADLAVACSKIAGRTPVIQAAMWTGTTHRAVHAHDGSVGALTVLPVRDGHPLLASGGSDGLVRLWDPDTGAPQGDPLAGHDDWVTAAAAVPLPDQEILLATGARDGTIRLWDPQTGKKPIGDAPTGHSGPVTAIAAVRRADDRTVLATGGRDGTVRLWDPVTRTPEGEALAAGGGWVTAAAAVPTQEGQLLATGSSDGTVQLWDPQTRQPVGDPLTSHQGPVSAIVAVTATVTSGDQAVLATGGKDGLRIQHWDPKTKKPVADLLTCHTSPVNAITVARLPHRTWFVTAGQDRKIRLWDVVTGATATLPVHARWVNAIAAVPLPDGRMLIATGGSDGKIELQELYESADGTLASAAPSTGHLGAVNAIAVAELPDRIVLATGSRDRTVQLWEPDTGEAARKDPLAGHTGSLSAVAAVTLPGGRTLIATSGVDGTVRLWDDPLAVAPAARLLKRYAQVYAIASVRLPDRTLLATGGVDGMVRLWDPVTGEPAGLPLAGHVGSVNAITSVRLADGGTLLASGGTDGLVRFWDPVTGLAAGDPLIGYGGRIRALAVVRLPDGGTLFATGGDYGVVQVWDGTVCKAVIEPPAGQVAPVNAIAAVELPGQTLLATGGDDGVVRLWDPQTGKSPAGSLTSQLTGHAGPVKAIASMRLPGGQTLLATGGDDKTILIWTFG